MFKRFARDTSANIAMMFGLISIPLIAATGGAIDYSRAYEQRLVVQDALDAATLAANRLLGRATEDEIYAQAQAFFTANTEGRVSDDLVLSMAISEGAVELTTRLAVPTSILGIVGVEEITFNMRALSVAGASTFEIALVLDNSGSMSGSKIKTLRDAAKDLIETIFAVNESNPQPNPVMFAIVPFAASVNVGPQNDNAAWMDTQGLSPIAALNFDDGDAGNNVYTSTFDLWDGMDRGDWGGCVEARPYPHDVTDTTPTNFTPATLFTTLFAPDEPGDENDPLGGFRNSYLDDDGGICDNSANPCDGLRGGRLRRCERNNGPWLTELEAQERTCKYEGERLAGRFDDLGQGPNLHCTTEPLTPLSSDEKDLRDAVKDLDADGYTNIEEGIMWGWRVLSDSAPFTEGRPYGDVANHKIMIVMTDGANTYVRRNNMNNSEYMAFNFITHGYLGTTSRNNNRVVDAMNERTLEACANIHETEIVVYTIAFQVSDADAQMVIEECATDDNKTFDASNNAELIAVFQQIADDITVLRIAE